MKKIAILPLDNRPCCYDFTERFGQFGVVKVYQPPKHILGGFTDFGQTEKIITWLEEIAQEVDGLILSIDQLAYGGLVPSRAMLRDFSESIKIVSVIKKIRQKFPDLVIYAANVLMRISITAKNKLYSKYWQDIFLYSQIYDRIHRLKESGLDERLDELKRNIPPDILNEYLEARERNHQMNLTMIEWVAEGILDFLVITQEDASAVGIHLVEQETLMRKIFELNVQRKVFIYPGADEATQTLLARMIQHHQEVRLRIYPKYLSTYGKLQVAKFEDRTIEESVSAHITAAGAVLVNDVTEADIILYVNTPVGIDKDGYHSSIEKANYNSRHPLFQLIESAEYDLKQGRKVSIADITFPNASDQELIQFLLTENLYYALTAYAGWNTAGNTLGTCITHSVFYYFAEKLNDTEADRWFKKHMAFMTERLLDEWAYQAQVRGEVNEEIVKELEIDGTHLEDQYTVVNEKVKNKMLPYINALSKHLKKHLGPQTKLNVLTCELPWNRTFEINVEVLIDD